MQKKLFALFIALIMLVFTLCACAGTGDGGETTPDSTSDTTPVSGDTSAPSVEANQIKLADLKDYMVVRAEDATKTVIDASLDVFHALEDYGVATIKTDFIVANSTNPKYIETGYEIIVGTTNRAASAELYNGMRTKDYGYALIGTKIVILGGTDEATAAAAAAFVKDVAGASHDGDVFMSQSDSKTVRGEYAVDSFSLAGVDISQYRIVYKSDNARYGEKSLALSLRQTIMDATGYRLDVVSDKDEYSGGHEILIGVTRRDIGDVYSKTLAANGYYIGANGNFVVLFGDSSLGLMAAVNSFSKSLKSAAAAGGAATLAVPETIDAVPESDKLTSMSFNLKVNPRTSERDERVITMILNYMPDTLGVQEASPGWMTLLIQKLSPYYNYVGEGRDGGNNGEYNTVFYLKDKFTLLEYGTKWLSSTPDYASRYAESSLNRIYTYAKLQRKSDGATFMHINTHLEHTSGEARVKQAKVLIEFINKNAGIPMIMSGDFNCTSGSDPYKTITSTGLADSSTVARQTESTKTFHNYGSSDKTLDYFFITPQYINVDRYHVCNEKINGEYPSDHHPIIIEYYLVD